MSVAERRFFTEITSLLDKEITVETVDGKKISGILIGVHPETLSICLGEAKSESGAKMHRVFLIGSIISKIYSTEKPFDLKGLAERLEKVFPTMVRLYEDKGFIIVMDRVKVTKDGVIEGSGPAAERVKRIYEQFVSETKGE